MTTAKVFLIDTGEEYRETTLIPFSDNWVGTVDAGLILNINAWASVIGPRNDYCHLRRKVRGTKGKPSARGQGWLWYVPDLLLVRTIRTEVKCSTKMALRLFVALREGRLGFLEGIGQ